MTTIQLPLDEITAQAREVHFGRALLTVIAAVFFAIGWVVARSFFCVAWCGTAVRLGWVAGRRPQAPPPGPSHPH